MKTVAKLGIAGAVSFALLQLARPPIPSGDAVAEVQAPPEVRQILEKHCYSRHSSETRLSWCDQIVPGYWLVRRDILAARDHLNFSTLGAQPAAIQKASLYEAVNMIQLGAMPLPQFAVLHGGAKVTKHRESGSAHNRENGGRMRRFWDSNAQEAQSQKEQRA